MAACDRQFEYNDFIADKTTIDYIDVIITFDVRGHEYVFGSLSIKLFMHRGQSPSFGNSNSTLSSAYSLNLQILI